MAQAPATTTSTTASSTNGNGTAKREVKVLTPIDAVTRISKILNQLSPTDRKRVLAFVNESNTGNE